MRPGTPRLWNGHPSPPTIPRGVFSFQTGQGWADFFLLFYFLPLLIFLRALRTTLGSRVGWGVPGWSVWAQHTSDNAPLLARNTRDGVGDVRLSQLLLLTQEGAKISTEPLLPEWSVLELGRLGFLAPGKCGVKKHPACSLPLSWHPPEQLT